MDGTIELTFNRHQTPSLQQGKYINNLAEESYKTIQNYDVKLPAHATNDLATRRQETHPFRVYRMGKMVQDRRKRETRIFRVYRMGKT
jgi:hypothetical protein